MVDKPSILQTPLVVGDRQIVRFDLVVALTPVDDSPRHLKILESMMILTGISTPTVEAPK